ncbi:lysylphosphatidylglycerol synthase transmembrane domain-containing protein [Methylocystis sp. JAN1]|uniref:lysylphosphatidylglycerol synthase transmembrane domain-containing protein n=1 Tax=Methylocystis sp. JAN1 TaxID=3397211 RepID=UPI003FA30FA9
MKNAARRGRPLAAALNAGFFAYVAYWLYENVSYKELLTEFRQIAPSAIFLAMAMNLCVLSFYGLRLAAILRAKTLPCFLIANIGFTFNSLIPFRIGEGVKIYFGATYFGCPVGGLGAAIVMEKLYDLSAILILAATVGSTSKATFIVLGRPTIFALALLLIGCGALIVWLRRRGAIPHPSEWRFLARARMKIFFEQAESSLEKQNASRAALFTTLIWTTNVCLVLLLFRSVLPGVQFGFLDAMTLLVIGALAIAVPTSPAGLGIFEAGIVGYLTSALGVQKERAISAALAYHLSITAPHTIIVVVFLGSMFLRQLKTRSM